MIGTKREIINFLINEDANRKFMLKEHNEKRSLSSNSYYWTLLNQLAQKLRIPSEELHFELLKKSAPFTEYLVLKEADLRAMEYYDIKGTLEKNGKEYNIVRVYLGSSKMNTKEMMILLDSLIEECKIQNIETMSENELKKLRRLENVKDKR